MNVLFDETEIARQVARMAREIAQRTPRVEIAVPVLTGAFVFAADLVRALSREGLGVGVEFLSMSRYGARREGGHEITVRLGPTTAVRGKHALLVDGVLDHGHTLVRAREMLLEAGAASVAVVVAVDKTRGDALLKADFAAFTGVHEFIVGYGMDNAGEGRSLPYIAKVG